MGRNDLGRFESQSPGADLLRMHLEFTVPMCLAEYQAQGGPTIRDYERARAFGIRLAAEGDQLLYRGKPGVAATLVAQLADALAILSYCPGGVTFLGTKWESQIEGSAALRAWMEEQARAAELARSNTPQGRTWRNMRI